MFNQKMYRAFSVAIPLVTTLLLFGILKAIFQIDVNTNLFSTGVTPSIIIGISQLILAFWIYKNRI